MLGTDTFSGALARATGEDAGSHAITQGTLTAGVNYSLNFTGADLTIGAKSINVTAHAQSKTYGSTDPALTYTSDALVGTDTFSGSLARAAGENVGTYAITQGALTAGSNYSLHFSGADLAITKAMLTVTADNQVITVHAADPTFSFSYSVFAGSDDETVIDTPPVCGVPVAHSAAGTYSIVCSGAADNNYDFTYANGTLTVNAVNNPTITSSFRSTGAQDGWVLESTETSNKGGSLNSKATTFNLGDDASRRQYRAILSFNTASLPDNAVITKITLSIRGAGLVGKNPFATLGKILVDIRSPFFGLKSLLGLDDFQAKANKFSVGAIAKTPSAGKWYATNLSSAAFTFLNKTGTTQFRLRFTKDDNNNAIADYLKFFSGNAPLASRPMLVIQYHLP